MNLHKVLKNALQHPVNREEALFLFKNTETEEVRNSLYAAARAVRKAETGNIFRLPVGSPAFCPADSDPSAATVLTGGKRIRTHCRWKPLWREPVISTGKV